MFKRCNVCRHEWIHRLDFIQDPDIKVIGYQANFQDLKAGLIYFNHRCRSTLAIPADAFADLYQGPVFQESKFQTDACPGYCLHKNVLKPCPAACECAYVREILQMFGGYSPGTAPGK